MPHSFGYRGRTRTLFKKAYKTKGAPHSTIFLRTFKVRIYALDYSFFQSTYSEINIFYDYYREVTMLILRSTPPSTRVCHSSTTTAALVLSSTSTSVLSVLSSTRRLVSFLQKKISACYNSSSPINSTTAESFKRRSTLLFLTSSHPLAKLKSSPERSKTSKSRRMLEKESPQDKT